jgi:hypothetical protein
MFNRFTIEDGYFKDEAKGVKAGNDNTVLAWLNELENKASSLEREIGDWKNQSIEATNENEVLQNELTIAREQGYKLSDAYLRYIGDRQANYDYWIRRQIERSRGLE